MSENPENNKTPENTPEINNQSSKESESTLIKLKDNLKSTENEVKDDSSIFNKLYQERDEYSGLAYKNNGEINLDNSNKDQNNITNKTFVLNANHKLNSKWCFWYISRKEKDHNIPYSERMKKIAEISSLEEFFKYYMFLKSPSDMERNTDLSIFKEAFQPLWESCPESGIWFIRFKKSDDPLEIDLRWERIVFALIGIFYFKFYFLNH